MKKVIFIICCLLIIVALATLQFIAIDSYIDEKLDNYPIIIEKDNYRKGEQQWTIEMA